MNEEQDRVLALAGLAALVIVSWLYLLRLSHDMAAMSAMDAEMAAMGMSDTHVWGAGDWFALFVMWAVMMMAMMLPSAAPLMLLVVGSRRRAADPGSLLASFAFIGGYVIAWNAFSAIAAALQVVLHRAAFLNAGMAAASARGAGIVLIAAGAYQWSPLKRACLAHCQSPVDFLVAHWRNGAGGGLRMGLRHGLYCIGCCWALMALLFATGVMNLLWVAGLGVFVLLEKVVPRGALVARATGAVLIGAGVVQFARGWSG